MPAILLLFLPDLNTFEDSTALEWIALDKGGAGGEPQRGCGTLRDTPQAAHIVAIVPVARSLFLETALPPVAKAKRDALLAYAIEDKLTIDPDTVHTVVLGKTHLDEYLVTVIDRAWLSAALAWLTGGMRGPTALVSEADAVAAARGEWVVMPGVPHGFVRRDDGFVVHLDAVHVHEVPFALTLALNEARNRGRAPRRLVVEAEPGAVDCASWSGALGLTVEAVAASSAAARAHRLLDASRTRNLLTGAFAPRAAITPLAAAARRAAVILAAMAFIHLSFTWIDNARMDAERRALEARMAATFRALFPEAQSIVDAPLQMERKLAQLKRERGIVGADAPRAALDRLAAFAARGSGLTPPPELMSIGIDGGVASMKLRVADAAQLAVLQAAAATIGGAGTQRVDEPSGRQLVVTLRIAP